MKGAHPMDFAIPIVAGIVGGIIAGSPYIVGAARVRKTREATILPVLVAACVSLLVMVLEVLIGWKVFDNLVIAFAIAMVVLFLATAVVSVVVLARRSRS